MQLKTCCTSNQAYKVITCLSCANIIESEPRNLNPDCSKRSTCVARFYLLHSSASIFIYIHNLLNAITLLNYTQPTQSVGISHHTPMHASTAQQPYLPNNTDAYIFAYCAITPTDMYTNEYTPDRSVHAMVSLYREHAPLDIHQCRSAA